MAITREEKKRQTRQSLLNAALTLVAEKGDFFSISLREVAREAGVVPTSFYRHFDDMEELGLSLVDEFGMLMRRIMRAARREALTSIEMQQKSVDTFIDYVDQNPNLFWFMNQARSSKQDTLRNAIESELNFFKNELVGDLRGLNLLPHLGAQDLDELSELVVGTVANLSLSIVSLPATQEEQRMELINRTKRQLFIIFLGAAHYDPKRLAEGTVTTA